MQYRGMPLFIAALGLGCTSEPMKVEEDVSENTPEPSHPWMNPSTEPSQPSSESEPSGDTQDTAPDPAGPDDDSDGDGWLNSEEGFNGAGNHKDSDGDGIFNYLDLDSDDDGIADEQETMSDADGDGLQNYEDPDSDNDGLPDGVEAQLDGNGNFIDTNGDGTPDYEDLDSDGDQIVDAIEGIPLTGGLPPDTDLDGLFDYQDLDSDADALSDKREGVADWDGDGIDNYRDPLNSGAVSALTLVPISTTFNSPIGIDYHHPSNSVIMSVNYSNGQPYNFEFVYQDGSHSPFSTTSGLTNEVKIAIARPGNSSGFQAGELFVGNGVEGEIVRIDPAGTILANPWVSLVGVDNGLMRGSLYLDDTGVYGDDLIAVTTYGEVWRIDSSGNSTAIGDAGEHLEGLITVPNAPARYGPLAGKIISGAENSGLLYAFDGQGNQDLYSLGVNIEDIDMIRMDENFFGVNYGSSRLLGVAAHEWRPMIGDILLIQEFPSNGGTGIFWLRWDGTNLVVDEIPLSATSTNASQWEHVTFAPAGIVEISPVTP